MRLNSLKKHKLWLIFGMMLMFTSIACGLVDKVFKSITGVDKTPKPLIFDSTQPDQRVDKTVNELEQLDEIHISFTVDYSYDVFPTNLEIILTSSFEEKFPYADLFWEYPDGSGIRLGGEIVKEENAFNFGNERLLRRLDGLPPHIALFSVPESDPPEPQQGIYELHITVGVFEPGSDVDARFIITFEPEE